MEAVSVQKSSDAVSLQALFLYHMMNENEMPLFIVFCQLDVN